MKRGLSIIVITVLLLVLLAIRILAAHSSSSTNLGRLVLSGSFIALAVLSVLTAARSGSAAAAHYDCLSSG